MAHTKKYILEHYVCDGQLSIEDLPFQGENVDNFVTDVDNKKCENSQCDICLNFECIYCKNEEVIAEAIDAYDTPFSDFSECPFGGYCNRESCFGCKVYEDNIIVEEG